MDNADTHTVDVSWLHHSQRDNLVRTKSAPVIAIGKTDASTPDTDSAVLASSLPTGGPDAINGTPPTTPKPVASPAMNPRQPLKQRKSSDVIEAKAPATPPTTPPAHAPTSANGNTSNKSLSTKPPGTGRRNSWISSLSSKFSSGSTSPAPNAAKDTAAKQPSPGPRPELHNPFGASFSPKDKADKKDEATSPFNSSSPKGHPSFFHNALRKFSSSSASGAGLGKMATHGVISERRIMNIDQNRDRCKVAELNQAKLRRVAFCVDVEIAGTSRRSESEEEEGTRAAAPTPATTPAPAKKKSTVADQFKVFKKQDTKAVDKGEGAALKAPLPAVEAVGTATPSTPYAGDAKPSDAAKENEKAAPVKEQTRKQEKKKRSEGERKERKEKKRRQAEANGTIPLQFTRDPNGSGASTPGRPTRGQDQPTTDPVRIYRRCCQLRETGVLKKLVEQISSPSSGLAESPGTVAVLDLTGFWMSLPDIITFSDWLAIVPVRKLILQNCGLTDEAVRVILAGLLSTKTIEESRLRRKISRKPSDTSSREDRLGAIEKLSLKDNPKIGHEGWRHIALFVHMSRSLVGIDLSGIPFPQTSIAANGPTPLTKPSKPVADIATVFSHALAERLAGNHLEELVISECYPSAEDLSKLCAAAKAVQLRRLGVANNSLTGEGLVHVIDYFQAGHCEGLDLGGNNLVDHLGSLSTAIQQAKDHPLSALSLADCSLTPKTLCNLLQALPRLPNFRFIDLSHNRGLFATQPDSLAMLRRFLPQMNELKRIHLADVSLSSEHAIALAEILPDCRRLCHINILENPEITALATAKEASVQEEACALYASLMTAVRVSHTLIAIDIDVPSVDNNEVVKALAAQIVAYSLRNLERGELVSELSCPDGTTPHKHHVPVPDILLHIVGNADNDDDADAALKPAPDEDYVISGTGVVKALGVCLGNADHNVEGMGDVPLSPSGTSTPLRRAVSTSGNKKPRDMSKNLLISARKIRVRLQVALVREDRAGNDVNYRRLQFLDFTLQRMIQRFEDEFPDTRLSTETESTNTTIPQRTPSQSSTGDSIEQSKLEDSTSLDAPPLSQSPDGETAIDDEDTDHYAIRLSRTSSNTSLHSRALTSEEGRVHRFGQHFRRDIIGSEFENASDGSITVGSDHPGEAHISALRERLERLRSSETQTRIELVGPDKALEELGSSLEELLALRERDPEAFATFKESQIAAQINAGLGQEQEGLTVATSKGP
ncbi:hypothetical protein FQN53_000643 [Emmonsiellopsis sp. PD_33]|nr:hypothetical protein FQN53_000643 [Emmonsiellopsis sp. PD_33]